MTTTSYLKRVFVEDNNVKNVDQQIQINSFLDGDTGAYSADEFVRVNFAVGQPSENPVIELDDVPLLVTDIANVGSGTVEYIYGYDLTFDGMNVEGDNDDCVYAEESNFFEEGNRNGDSILVGSCYMEIDYSIEQEVEEDGISFRIFEANVGYLYTLQEQIAVEVDLR